LSAILSAPWERLWHVAFAVALTGLGGLVYAGIVVRRARRQTDYQPVFEDWLWHAVLPAMTYAMLLVAGGVLARYVTPALFTIGAGSLILMFIGIHNAWDTVTYVAFTPTQEPTDGNTNAAGSNS